MLFQETTDADILRSRARQYSTTPSDGVDELTSITEKFGLDSFEVEGFPKILWEPTERVEERCGIRLAPRVVPFVDGEQLDETGLEPKVFEVVIVFSNELHRSVPELGSTPVMYPDRMRLLGEIFDKRKTGTLALFGRRAVRAKAHQWSITENVDQLVCGVMRVTFRTDNEGKLDAAASESVSVAANLQSVADAARFDAQREGADTVDLFIALNEATSQLETALRTPDTQRSDLAAKASGVRSNVDRVIAALSTNKPGRDKLSDPEGERCFRNLFLLRLLSLRAESEARSRDTKVRTARFPQSMSLWQIATLIGASGDELSELNPSLPDSNHVTAGTAVNVPEDLWPARR